MGKWKTGVTLALEGLDKLTTIDSTQAASWAMIEDWPMEDGTALDRALTVCGSVGDGSRTDEDARKAFIEAAIEAGIYVRN